MEESAGLPEIGILADDLAGAVASAERLRQRGLRAVVQWGAEDLLAAEAIVVNLGTREIAKKRSNFGRGEEPDHIARDAAKSLFELGCRRFELRVDSTFRGHA